MLILLWWLPFWALSPFIADWLGPPPTTAQVTTVFVIVQTVIGLLGFLIAGRQVKTILNGTPKKQAFGNIWHILLHGTLRDTQTSA